MDNVQQDKLKIITFRKENGNRIYSTYVRVVSNPYEVTLQFSDIKPPANDIEQEEVKKSKEIKTPIDAEIVLPFDVAKEFLSILDKRISLADSKQKQLLAESKKKGK